jgi:hypothetical protein
MSAKITVILYVLVYFELGAILIVAPWTSFWSDNVLLAYLVQRTGSAELLLTFNSLAVKASVTGLGVLNLILGVWEASRYRDLLRLIEEGRRRPSTPDDAR